MNKTYEIKNNPEYNNIQNNLSNPELYTNYLPQEFEPNLNVKYSYNKYNNYNIKIGLKRMW